MGLVFVNTVSAATNTFYASDDVWMWGTSPMSGTEATMNVESANDKKSYLKFTVSGVGTVTSATLNVRCTTGGTATIGVYAGINNNTWTETAIAWNNRPDVGTLLESKNITFAAGTTYSFNVGSLVNGNGTYSFIIQSTSGAEVIFSTKEGTVGPTLVVVDGAATPTPTPTGSSVNVAAGKIATGSAAITNAARITDGDKNSANFAEIGATGAQWAKIDFGASYNISQVNLWHYFADSRTYHDVIVQFSNNANFTSGVTTVFNNDTNNSAGQGTGAQAEYAETSAGKTITFTAVNARYMRTWINGSSANVYNHIVELEAWTAGGATPTPAPTPTPGGAPYVSGNKMYHGNGTRLIIKGVNLECGRYNDPYYHNWFDGEYNNRVAIANLIDSNGFNAVRLNAGAAAYNAQTAHYTQLETLIELYASKGIYSMPTTHDYTSAIPDVNALKSFYTNVINNARSAGYERWLIINPWNEGSDYAMSTWVTKCKAMLDHLRTTCNFRGIVAFDTPAWAFAWDSASADQVINYDKALLGGASGNVVISNHWYPWTSGTAYTKSDNCSNYPMLVGELGRWVDEPQPNTTFALDLIDHICSSDIPNGHNGIFLWMWRWSDWGSMTDNGSGNGTQLNSDWGIPSIQHMTMAATKGN
jgi:hypothetical protein